MTNPRPLYTIARDIRNDWKKPYFGAIPYIDAMSKLENIEQSYYCDSAHSVVLYFLANANTWRGENARAIKKELKTIAGIK